MQRGKISMNNFESKYASANKSEPLDDQRAYYTPRSLANRWGCCIETVYDLLRAGKLRGFKLGKDWRITDEARIEYETCGGVPDRPKARIRRGAQPILRIT